jgi:hypothetical protein
VGLLSTSTTFPLPRWPLARACLACIYCSGLVSAITALLPPGPAAAQVLTCVGLARFAVFDVVQFLLSARPPEGLLLGSLLVAAAAGLAPLALHCYGGRGLMARLAGGLALVRPGARQACSLLPWMLEQPIRCEAALAGTAGSARGKMRLAVPGREPSRWVHSLRGSCRAKGGLLRASSLSSFAGPRRASAWCRCARRAGGAAAGAHAAAAAAGGRRALPAHAAGPVALPPPV